MNGKSEINFKIDGLDPETVERWRKNIEILITQKVFALRNGKTILNFDAQGNIMTIQFDYTAWRADKNKI